MLFSAAVSANCQLIHELFVQVGNLSRLQCVKAAVINQLKQIHEEHPTRKVALVTFDSNVCYCYHYYNDFIHKTISITLLCSTFGSIRRIYFMH